MILRSLRLSASATLLTSLSLAASLSFTSAKKDGPTIQSNSFENALETVFYFDDSNVILGQDRETSTVWRSIDAGAHWDEVNDKGQAGYSWDLWPHPYDNQRAYILGTNDDNWVTTDQGETWTQFNPGVAPALFRREPLSFHGRDPKKVIWNGEKCTDFECQEIAMYTDDDFKTTKVMGDNTRGCYWAVGTPQFAQGIDVVVEDRIFCILEGLYSPWPKDNRMVVSDDYFNNHQIEPDLDEGRAVTGIISMAAVKGYLVAAAKSEGTDELALYVTDDASEWHRAEFGQHRIEEDAYTILESTNYSMQVDVLGSKPTNPMGYLFTSNSNGTYFTRNIDHTNRNRLGRVDFEKVSGIQGIVLVNIVDNWEEVERSVVADKRIVSRISFDDGRTFDPLMVGKEELHLHSVTDAKQGGRIFSSPAPGIVMGVGNTGKFLKSYEEGDLYVSDDAGVSWTLALDGAHLYEFGNQGAVLVAVNDEEPTSQLMYSIDHGKTWEKADLGVKIRARFLTTVPDSTTLKFLLMGSSGAGSKTKWHVFKIDFEGLHERSCKKSDFERWAARVDSKGNPSCIMGHKQFFRRRKGDADCFIDEEFKDPVPQFEPCTCTQADFECDFNFIRDPKDRTICNPADTFSVPEGVCKSKDDKFRGPSGWRLIPGNECTRKGGEDLDKEIERSCLDAVKKPASGEVLATKKNFEAEHFAEWHYLQRTDASRRKDETIIMRTDQEEIFMTDDHGKTWNQILKSESIVSIAPNPYFHDTVYFLTGGKEVHYTINRGETFDKFTARERPSNKRGLPVLRFHPFTKEWLLWSAAVGSDDHTDILYSTDRGDNWNVLARHARKCDFLPRETGGKSTELIICEQYEDENPDKSLQLLSSENFFKTSSVHFPSILDYATMAEFIIVAAKTDDGQSLKVDASVDGQTYAPAAFPHNFVVPHQQAYTVLDSSTHAVFLHVTVNTARDREFGSIIKSNSNGTSYVLALRAVNRDVNGFVDFEKMQGLEGVAMVNIVSNREDVEAGGKKMLKSMITHNDGAQWDLMPPPGRDALGNAYECVSTPDKADPKCSLHIHSYTERADKSATFSSPSAVGLMMAVGNVGEYLLPKSDPSTDTFITRDAGITWRSVKKGSYMWEYGDQGSVIVIVEESKPTRTLFYSLDEGEKWREFEFSPDVDMQIDAITTVPQDNSLNFLLWGRELGTGAKRGIFTINIDFSGLKERQRKCDLDEDAPTAGDYELWEPRHPMQDSNCLFGHVAQYHRKKIKAECYNGYRFDHLHNIERNCSCTRQDFECDYNFQMINDGSCQLVEGLQPKNHEEFCKENPDRVEFWKPTGYRRIPLTTCEGGKEMDKIEAQPCPGHESEFEEKHGVSGLTIFFAVVIPVLAAVGVGYWVWNRYASGYGMGFGQIRLGDSASAALGGSRSGGGDPLWITIPVTIISGVVAVAKATPLLISSLYRSAKGYTPLSSGTGSGNAGRGIGGRFGAGRGYAGNATGGPYRSRDSFATRRQDYSEVVEDDELLGEGDEDGEEV